MIPRLLLMCVPRIKGHTLIHISLAIPIPGSVARDFRRAIPVKGIPAIEHRDAVHEVSNGAKAGERLGRRCCGRARYAIKHVLIRREVWKSLCMRCIEVPWSHDVGTQARCPNV